jgi:hypothetical protein
VDINNFQRVGSTNNTQVGDEFEDLVAAFFSRQGVVLQQGFGIPVGVGEMKKQRRFDFGSEQPPILIECKSHAWTGGGNVPSAKITVWNEAMYYFHIAPAAYRKILFVLKSVRGATSLASYYVRCYGHLIPQGVEVWEYDVPSKSAERVH